MTPTNTHIIAIGGVDPHGGAGLLRDAFTARSLGATFDLVVTALTEQGDDGVVAVEPRDPAALAMGLARALREAPPETAVKIGMLGTPALAAAVAIGLGDHPVVLDPVLGASAGGSLFDGDPALLVPLLARATLVTPNRHEAATLAGRPVDDFEGMLQAAAQLRRLGARAVLIKGGHFTGEDAVDLLVTDEGATWLEAPRVPGRDPRGTGCALATAIAVGLARGRRLEIATREAKGWLHAQIAAAVPVGRGWHLP